MMVYSKKSKVKTIVSTILFLLVFVGMVVASTLIFSTMKADNDEKFDQRVVATGAAVDGEVEWSFGGSEEE